LTAQNVENVNNARKEKQEENYFGYLGGKKQSIRKICGKSKKVVKFDIF